MVEVQRTRDVSTSLEHFDAVIRKYEEIDGKPEQLRCVLNLEIGDGDARWRRLSGKLARRVRKRMLPLKFR